MTPPPPVPLTPDDVLAAVVAALGSWPAESLVLVGLGPRRRLGTVVRARVDLLLQGEPDDAELGARVDAAVEPCAADGARGVVVLLLTEHPEESSRLIGAAGAALGRAGVALADAAVLQGARWTSPRGSWTSPAAARVLADVEGAAPHGPDPDDATGACAAALAVLRAAGTTQEALDEHLLPAWFDALDRVVDRATGTVQVARVPLPPPGEGSVAIPPAAAGAPAAVPPGARAPGTAALGTGALGTAALDTAEMGTAALDAAALDAAARGALDAPLAAWLLLGLGDPARRDAVLASVLPGGRAALTATRPTTPPPTRPGTRPPSARDRWGRAVTGVLDAGSAGAPAELDAAAALLRRLAELAPVGVRADPLAVLAWWAWWRGRPEQAEVLAAQALAAHPGHGLAGLVLSCAGHRLVPAWARALAREDPLDPARAVIYPPRRS